MNQQQSTALRITDLSFAYPEQTIFKNMSVNIPAGVSLIQCDESRGKSTLLRVLGCLLVPDSGTLHLNGELLPHDEAGALIERRRNGFVFQGYNLFPHLTILQNLTLAPIWVRGIPKAEAEETAMKYLTRVRIPEQANKYPGQLSGGQ